MALSAIEVKPIHDRIIVGIYDDGDATMMLGGRKFYLLDDTRLKDGRTANQKHTGIRPRWAIVLAVSDEVEQTGEVKPLDRVLLEFGEWTRAVPATIDGKTTKLWSIPVTKVLGVTPSNFSDNEREQISRLYPEYEAWQVEQI